MAEVTITLGGLELDPDLQWQERKQTQRVAQSAQATLGGSLNVLAVAISVGLPITLESGDDFGFLTTDQVDQLRDMANDVGAVYELEIVSGSNVEAYSVIFRHHEPPAFDARPLIPRVIPEADDYFRASIKLITVE
jgi:hypothetical protein